MQITQLYLLLTLARSVFGFVNGTYCPKACTFDYNPICAHNGKVHKTFSNECDLERSNCMNANDIHKHRFNGECGDLEGVKCEHYCPINSEPICGFNGKTHREFPNLCYLERFNCLEDDVFVPRFNGYCWNYDCKEDLCSFKYEPICAHDGVIHRTFSNRCNLDNYNCRRNFFKMEKKFNGECGDLFEGKKCDEKCFTSNSVCAKNGYDHQEFRDECALRLHICSHAYNILEFTPGKCSN